MRFGCHRSESTDFCEPAAGPEISRETGKSGLGKICFIALFAVAMFWPGEQLTAAVAGKSTAVDLSSVQNREIGAHIEFLVENDGPMTLAAAVRAFAAGGQPSQNSVLNFGIGSNAVWLHFEVINPRPQAIVRRLIVETAWLDQIEVFFRHDGQTLNQFVAGDIKVYADRPIDQRFFAFDHEFSPGQSSVYLRVTSPDSMVLPIMLISLEQARAREINDSLVYGLMYGFIVALLAYNATLFVGLRNIQYLYYVLYLSLFVLMNLAYTGHGFQWIWPQSPALQSWVIYVAMGLYSAAGLMFARSFLNIRSHFPRVNKILVWTSICAVALLVVSAIFSLRVFGQIVAFPFMVLFSATMIVLGVLALRIGVNSARYFLLATIAAMIGASVTPLAVGGVIPYNSWTYHALEIGMSVEAILLALALADQFRIGREQRIKAERLSAIDPLTKLKNRRAFYRAVIPVLETVGRTERDYAVILLDIDRFKVVNDTYGHSFGDDMLVAAANTLARECRRGDVLARWGGEEFIYFLPDTDIDAATGLAERLRQTIEHVDISFDGERVPFTASLGVACRDDKEDTLKDLINRADAQLYRAKDEGRNRVCSAEPATTTRAPQVSPLPEKRG